MLKEIARLLEERCPASHPEVVEAEVGDSFLFVNPEKIVSVCQTLKSEDSYRFNVLQLITGMDREEFLEVSYILASFVHNLELILKVKLPRPALPQLPALPSVCSIWKSADFQERECYDMMGVNFTGHPDLRRILCPYEDWEGYPLRKDYRVQDKYLNMTVNPPEKINTADHYFYKKVEEEAGENAKKILHSWKD